MRWIKDPKVEANLRRLGVKFEIETGIALPDIDRDEGMRRQVRLQGKLMDDVALRYAMAMEEPEAAFPMPILQKERKRRWPWSGNHRLAAAELAKVELVDAYVVEVFDPVLADLLPRLVNTWEAVVGMSRDEAIINARFMIDKHGMEVGDAAKLFGVKKDTIYSHARAEEVKNRIESVGVPTNGFAQTTLVQLNKIGNLNALRETAAILHKRKLKGKEAQAIIDDVCQRDTEAQQLEELKRWTKSLDARDKPKKNAVKLPHKEVKRERLFRLLTGLARFLEVNKTTTQAQVTDPAHQLIVRGQWKVIQTGMRSLLGD